MVPAHQVQHSRRGRARGYSQSWIERDVTSIGDVARGREGYALGLTDHKELRWIELTPSYADERFRDHLSRAQPSRERSRER